MPDERKKFFLLIYYPPAHTIDLDTRLLTDQGKQVLFAEDKKITLELIKQHEVAAVLTIYEGQNTNAIMFLRHIMHQHPNTQRILLTTRVDKNLMEMAINKAHINYFLMLPVPDEELCTVVSKSFRRYENISNPYKKISVLMEYINKFRKVAETDTLTQLLNRRAFMSILRKGLEIFQTENTRFSLIMLDLDHFKKLNDTYGHPAGDKVLRTFGEILRRNMRKEDWAFRYGGEEFAIIAQMESVERIKIFIERILHEVNETTVIYNKQKIRFSFSGGIAPMETRVTRSELINRADAAMYSAKQQGRNRIVVFEPGMLSLPPKK